VSLDSGAVRWRTKSAAKPLALAGDRLVAQAESRGNTLKIVVLDARSGAAHDTVRISLPDGVAGTVVDTPRTFFRVRADSADSKVTVYWEGTKSADAEPLQGYLPAEEALEPKARTPKVLTGQAVLDLAASSPSVKSLQAEPGERPATVARAALEQARTPVAAAPIERQFLSADGRHVLVTEPVNTAEFTLERHRWTVYERESGLRLGSVPAIASAMPFLVVGTNLYAMAPAHAIRQGSKFVEQRAALRAVNLQTGTEMWKSAVLETDFSGPLPP
jgi:hypothetical protein